MSFELQRTWHLKRIFYIPLKKVNSLYIYICVCVCPLNSFSAGLTKENYYATWQGYLALF